MRPAEEDIYQDIFGGVAAPAPAPQRRRDFCPTGRWRQIIFFPLDDSLVYMLARKSIAISSSVRRDDARSGRDAAVI